MSAMSAVSAVSLGWGRGGRGHSEGEEDIVKQEKTSEGDTGEV